MDKRIEELVNFTKEKYSLQEFYLHEFIIYRSITTLKDTVYTLSMEWFPSRVKIWNDESTNPEGTACIEIDMHSRKVKRIIFSKGISIIDGMKFDLKNRNEIIKWIENETGLIYGKQFEFRKQEKRAIYFNECIDGVRVSNSGNIEVKLDEEGRLTLFSVYGQFPSEKLIRHEKYTLSLKQIEVLAKEQLKLVEFPIVEQKKLVPAFAIEEIYIKNSGLSTLSFDDNHCTIQMDKIIEWDHKNLEVFQRKIISFIENVTPDQAFQCEPHPDLRPITEDEMKKCVGNIQMFFSQEYRNDSGLWVLKSLYRDKGYIHATLIVKEQQERVFKRKLKLFIDSVTFQVLNYMDNKPFLKAYMELTDAEEIKVTREEAFEKLKLKDLLELTPYYVYDFEQGNYVLCGRLDCQFAVKANNGEVVELSEL